MKIICATFLTALLLIIVQSKVIGRKIRYDECSDSTWIFTDAYIVEQNNSYTIVAGVAYGEHGSQGVVRQVNITLGKCNPHVECLKNVTVSNVDCNLQQLNPLDKEVCNASQEIAKLESSSRAILRRYLSGILGNFCVDYVDDSVIYMDTNSSSEESTTNNTSNQ